MKTLIPLTALAALFASSSLFAQTPAFSKPSGYVTLGNPDGNPATPDVPANTDVTVSIPFERPAEFVGKVSSVSDSVLTLNVDNLPSLSGDPAIPYQINITSGVQEGLIGIISANTSSTITIGSVIVGDVSEIENDGSASFSISKAWTLGTFFPSSIPGGTQLLAYSGTVAGPNLAANLGFVWTGSAWLQQFGATAAGSNTIIFPGESFVIRTGNNPITSLVVTGTVPVTKSKTVVQKLELGKAQDTRISFNVPVDQPIENLTGMQGGDQLLAFNNTTSGRNKAASEILVYTGTFWLGQAGVTGDQTGIYKLKAGQGYVLRRGASAPVGDRTLVLEPDYIDNL